MELISTVLALPVLILISIPLVISACITISFALLTLLLRLSVVYLELGYALVATFFTLPTSTTSSFLTFAPSEPPTPVAGNSRRNSAYSLIQSRQNDPISSWASTEFQDDHSKHRKKKNYARSMIEAHHLSTSIASREYSGLPISGDERRDFEGVGGWRSYPNSSRSKPRSVNSGQEKPLSSASSSRSHSMAGEADVDEEMDPDERAWLSLNDRLELPSQVITFGAGSATPSAVGSPRAGSLSSSYVLVPASSSLHKTSSHQNTHAHASNQYPGRRHHHRSHTTSALSTSDLRNGCGLSLSLSTRPDQISSRSVSPSTVRHPCLQPYSPMQRSSMRSLPASSAPHGNGHATVDVNGMMGGGGYFALPRPDGVPVTSYSTMASPVSSEWASPGDRDSPSQLTRFMAHYPTSMRHRRRSLSGPHAWGDSIGERLA